MTLNYVQVFQLLQQESEAQGWPTAYESDLLSDQRVIEGLKPEAFVWVLREYGTHIFAAEWQEKPHAPECHGGLACWSQCSGSRVWLRAVEKTYPEGKVYLWEQGNYVLRPSNYPEARRFLLLHGA